MGETVLHGYFRSSPSWRVRMALAWKGIAFQVAPVNILKGEQSAPAYLTLNPQGRVPLLEIDGLSLVQAPAILEYLEETRPEPPLLPADAQARARVRAMAALIATDITPLQNLNVGRRLKAQFGADDAAVADWSRAYIEAGLAELERQAGVYGGRFLYGDAFSLADVHLVPQMIAARRFGAAVGPRLQAVEARCLELPAVFDTRPEAQPDAPAG
ncbi:MAG: maleylacetoacetate isomerase [Caulobacteraceae bacterium]|nr:maleylacetoacetate isomerase [Caulobacter sp.]